MAEFSVDGQIPAPYSSWEDLIANIRREVPASVKVLMADLIMAWATVDSIIAQLTGAEFGLDPMRSAIVFGRTAVPDRLNKLRKLMVQLGRTEDASALRRLQKEYADHSAVRNLLAHAKCAGMLEANPPRLVFLPFDAHGGHGNLAIEIVPLEALVRSKEWGNRLEEGVLHMLNEAAAAKKAKGGSDAPPKNSNEASSEGVNPF